MSTFETPPLSLYAAGAVLLLQKSSPEKRRKKQEDENIKKTDNNNLNQKIMKTLTAIDKLVLIVAILFLSTIALGQGQNDENTFSKKQFKSVRSDANKSNPVESVAFESSTSGSQYQTDSNYELRRKLDVNTEISKQQFQKRQETETRKPSGSILSNYPNPFSDKTTIAYEVKGRGNVSLKVYYNGYPVATLIDNMHISGGYQADFEVFKFPAGVYTVVLSVGDQVMTKDMYKVK